MRYAVSLLALGLLVALHELGHMLVARMFKVKVHRYAIGFGPAVFTLRGRATEYSLRAIPLGGFVQIHGMNPHEEGLVPEDPSSYASLRPWRRALILFAGPAANYLIALALAFVLYVVGTHVPVEMTIGTVEPGSEAARALLRPGDQIVAVDGAPVKAWTDFARTIANSGGRTLALAVRRDGAELTAPVRPRRDEHGAGRIGVAQQYIFQRFSPGDAVGLALAHTGRLVAQELSLPWVLLRRQPGVEMIGPIGIVDATGDALASGLDAFLRVLVSLSVALAVFNLLPVPALDGGRLLFVGVEVARGRPAPAALETVLHTVGFFALIALVVWVAIGDVRRLTHPDAPAPASAAAAPDAGVPADAGR